MEFYACKKSLLTVIFLFSFLASTVAQESWAAWSHTLDTKGLEGRRFRLQASVKVALEDDSATARLWVRVDKKTGMGFFDNMQKNPIRTTEWKTYTIEGTIDSTATRMLFGVLVTLNGRFFYDNYKVEVEGPAKKWRTVYANNFDSTGDGLIPGIGFGKTGTNVLFTQVPAIEQQGSNKAFIVQSANVPNYGFNKKAGKFAAVNGIQLYYEIYGEGQPLVVLHGNGGSIGSASSHYPDLIKKYKVIAIDSRGQGRSTDTDAPLTYDQMASDVNALLEQIHVDSADIWGQSDGAILGLLMAMDYPKKVKRVIACGANVKADSTAVFSWALRSLDKTISTSKDAKEVKLNTMMRDYPNIAYEKLHTIKAPCLIMGGDRDVIRPEHLVKMFQNIPHSQMCILPGTTHGEAWDKKEQFLQILYDFFDKPFTMPDTKDWFE